MVYSVKTKVVLSAFAVVFLLAGKVQSQTNTTALPKPIQGIGIENFYQLTEGIYSGSSPEGEAAFEDLKKRGVKTLISVDGAKPDVARAKKFGLRYVHLPFGYDGVPTNQAVRLVKASAEMPKPIYVHCHHGLHRGPAGAAIICEGTENWTPEQALQWMKQAGTSTNYLGLYRSVETFHRPSNEELKKISANLPETTEVSPLVDAMVEIDERFDNLKLIKKADYQQPPSHPDLAPAHEALLLNELFKELLRTSTAEEHGQKFRDHLVEAEKAAHELHLALSATPVAKEKAETCFQGINNACTACHKSYRNSKAGLGDSKRAK